MATKDRTALKDEFKNGNLATGERFADLIDSMKVVQLPVVDPQALGTSLSFIDSISQDADGVITATKKTLDLANAHEINPFKGWWKTGDTLPTTGFDGAYLYFKDTTQTPAVTTIYQWNGTTYADTGTVVDESNVNTFGSGQALNTVKIKDENGDEDAGADGVLSAEAGKELYEEIYGGNEFVTLDDIELTINNYHIYYSNSNKVRDALQSLYNAYTVKLPCQDGDKFRVYGAGLTGSSASVGRLWAFTDELSEGYYDVLEVAATETNTRDNGVELIAPTGSKFLFINFFSYDATKDFIQKWEKVNLGLIDKIKFNSGQNLSDTKIIDNLTTDSANDVLSAKQGMVLGNEIYDTINFVDISGIQENKYYNTNDNPIGVLPVNYNGTGCVRVECTPGDVFKVFGLGTTNIFLALYTWTTSSRNPIYRDSSTTNYRNDGIIITAPEGAAYLYVNFNNYDSETDKLQKQVVTNTGLKNKVAELETNLHSALFGKNIVVFGDSLSEFKNSDGKGWCDLAAEISGANFISVAIGGTQLRQRRELITLFDETKTYNVGDWVYYKPSTQMNCYECVAEHSGAWSDADFTEVAYNYYIYSPLDIINLVKSVTNTDIAVYADRFTNQVAAAECVKAHLSDDNESIIARLSSIDWSDVNAVVIMAGANDFGDLRYGTSGSFDINRTFGAINEMVRLLSSTYKKIPIYFVIETVRWFNYSGGAGVDSNWCDVYVPTGGTLTYKEFFAAISNEAIINHLPVIDLYNTLGWNKWNFSNFFDNNDGTHPYKGFRQIAERVVSGIIANKVFE